MQRRDVLRGGVGTVAAMLARGAGAAAPATSRPRYVNSIALEDARVWIAAKIGEAGPYFSMVDTGADYSFIDMALARSLKMEPVGLAGFKGVGGRMATVWLRAPDVRLASGLHFPHMLFAGLRSTAGIGRDAAGLFGCGLFTTFDSDLDFAKGEWRVYPQGRGDFAGLRPIPSRFLDHGGVRQIVADVGIDGFAGRFVVDTGAPGELLLTSEATRRSGLWRNDRPYAPPCRAASPTPACDRAWCG